MNGTMDIVKFTKNMTTGMVKDVDNVEVSVSKSTSTGLQIMSNPLVRLLFQKTAGSSTTAYALPADLHWTATLDTDFDHASIPIGFTEDGFNADGSWDGDTNPSYTLGQLTFPLNLKTEGALARLGKKSHVPGYLEVCGWSDETAEADLIFSSRIAIRISNVLNPSNVAAVPYDVDVAVTDAIDAAVGTHDDAAGAHPVVPTSVTTAITTHNNLDTAHGMASMAGTKAHVESAHGVSVTQGFAGGVGAEATTGGAVGKGAVTTTGFAGGVDAVSAASVQLGTGTNNTAGSLQVYDKVMMNADGTVPLTRLALVQPLSATLVSGVATDPTAFTARFVGDVLCGQAATNKKQMWVAFATGTAGWLSVYLEP
jgi:hypothetical protein